MSPLRHLFGSFATTAVFLGAALLGKAQLAPTSPFLPFEDKTVNAAQGPAGPIELRGIMATSQGTSFCIYDVTKKTSEWVKLNEPGTGFTVKSYKEGSDSATIEVQGQTMTLTLKESKVASAGGYNPGGNYPPPQYPPAQPMNPTVLNPTPADEAHRLEAVAAEVQRRRMLRQQAGARMPTPPPSDAPPGMGRPGH